MTAKFLGVTCPVDADDERKSARLPASTPASASSSMTTDRCGTAPSLRVASNSTAGSGLPGSSMSWATTPSTRTVKKVAETGVLQDVFTVAARRVDARRDACVGQLADADDCGLEDGNARVQTLEEDLLLAPAEPGNRVLAAISSGPRRERNPPRPEEVDHTGLARLAVHEVPVVVVVNGEWSSSSLACLR
jgi:hypothetical protein